MKSILTNYFVQKAGFLMMIIGSVILALAICFAVIIAGLFIHQVINH